MIDYAESEVLLREGEDTRALALATQAAVALRGDRAARAHLVAGTAARQIFRFPVTEEQAAAAEVTAESAETLQRALWLSS